MYDDYINQIFYTWGYEEHGMLFIQPGTYLFRWGLALNLPWNFSLDELWWNMAYVGQYDQDTLVFTYGVPDAELSIIQPCEKDWLPVIEGYIDSTGQPNYTDFKVYLKALMSSVQGEIAYTVRWVLTNISWYTQACMNYPHGEAITGPPGPPTWRDADLMILGQYNNSFPIPLNCSWDSVRQAFYGETRGPVSAGETLQVCVTCYDFGAHGNIFLEVLSPETNYWYNLTKYQESDSTWLNYSTIPIDEDGYGTNKDKLADHWEELMLADPHCPDTITSITQIQPWQDNDWYINGVLPSESGDYLNVFEEYRGFYCNRIHTRTIPWVKDFFIYSNMDSLNFNTGIGWADSIGPGLGHWINSNEMMSYSEPSPHIFLPIWARSVNWYNDRIDSTDTCACAILLNNTAWDSSSMQAPIGETWHLSLNYIIPRTTAVGYVYTNRIRAHTPPNIRDTVNVDLPPDSLCQLHVAGHEIGHMVDMRHNPTDSSSIMFEFLLNFRNPSWEYKQADLDSFLIKPPQ